MPVCLYFIMFIIARFRFSNVGVVNFRKADIMSHATNLSRINNDLRIQFLVIFLQSFSSCRLDFDYETEFEK